MKSQVSATTSEPSSERPPASEPSLSSKRTEESVSALSRRTIAVAEVSSSALSLSAALPPRR
jgi:hypothetical protein